MSRGSSVVGTAMAVSNFFPQNASPLVGGNDFVVDGSGRYFASGGYSDIYLGFNNLKQPVAIKIIRLDGNIQKAQEEFRSEMDVHSSLGSSPFLIQYLGFYLHDRFAGVVMEYAPCGNLHEFLHNTYEPGHRNRVAVGTSLRNRMIHEIISGIQYLHNIRTDQRAIHGDLKPSNILLSDELHAKLADFGCTKLQTLTQQQTTSRLPVGDTNVISVRYTAPEVLSYSNRKKRASSDVYSFGIIVWEMWRRTKPYHWCSTKEEVQRAILSRAELSTPLQPTKEDAGIVQLFLRCREDADNRPSATDIVVDFPLKLKKLEAMSQALNVRQKMGNAEPRYPANAEFLWRVLDAAANTAGPSPTAADPHQPAGHPRISIHTTSRGQHSQGHFFGGSVLNVASMNPMQALRLFKQYLQGVLPDNLRSQYQKEVQEIEYRLQHQDLQEESTEGYMRYEEIPQPDRHQQQLLATQQPHSSNQPQDPQQNQHQTHKSSLRKLLPKSSKSKSKKLAITIFLAGESGVGKHWLINQYVNGDASKPTEKQNKQLVIINGVRYNLKLMTEISDLKPRKIINLVLLCFAIDDLSSCQKLTQLLRNVAKQLRIKTTHIPRWVVALKEDLRGHQDAHDRIIPEDREKTIVSQLSAQKFFRCSARTGQGVKELFAEALKFYKEQNESK